MKDPSVEALRVPMLHIEDSKAWTNTIHKGNLIHEGVIIVH